MHCRRALEAAQAKELVWNRGTIVVQGRPGRAGARFHGTLHRPPCHQLLDNATPTETSRHKKVSTLFICPFSLGTFSRWHQIMNLNPTPFDESFLHVTSPSNPVFARQELGKSWREKCDVDQTMGGARKWQLLLEGTLKAAFVRDSRCRCRGERPRFLLLFPADENFHAFSSQYK